MKKPSIAFVICYFGELPNYFNLTERTIRDNPTIDWIIIGDALPKSYLPNLKMINMSIDQYSALIQKKTNILVNIGSLHSIYNLKPLYGVVFLDLLNQYDFWGFTDLDILFGDLRRFLSKEILETHDRIHCRGHLSIYKNTEKVNTAFMLSAPGCVTYQKLLEDTSNPMCQQFDEWRGMHRIMRYHGFLQYHSEVIADITAPTRYRFGRFETSNLPNYKHQIFYWYQGKTYRAYLHPEGGIIDEEVAYIHFQKRQFPDPDPNLLDSKGIGIGPKGFFSYNREYLTIDDFDKLNPDNAKPLSLIIGETKNRICKKWNKLIT